MSFPRYPKYKPSGVEWLGDVPDGWESKPLKYSTLVYTGNSLNETEKNLYESTDPEALPYISSKDIDLETHEVQYENGLRIPKGQCGLKVAPSGSFLLCVEGGSAGRKVALLRHDVCFVNKLCCFSSRQNNKFRFYFSQSQNFKDKFGLSLTGLIGGVSTSLLKNFQIPTPSDSEQTAIAEFLDRETGKIDGLVAEQRRLMELLKEKRQAVISHAVTKGLNPHAPMKPSGIEWLGEVPAGWEVWKFAHFAPILTCGVAATPEYVEDGIPFLSAQNVKANRVLFENHKYISEETHKELTKNRTPTRGDVLLSRVGTIGEAAVIESDKPFSIFVSLTHIRCEMRVCLNHYVVAIFESAYFRSFSKVVTVYGGGVGNLNVHDLCEFKIPLPPISEQRLILDFIRSETTKLDTLTAEAHRAIDLLQERRTALISAAVTGQIDVRGLAKHPFTIQYNATAS